MSVVDDDLDQTDGVTAQDAARQVVYDCTAWAGESRGMLDGLLDSHGVRHAWQGTILSVFHDDEEAVDELIDDVLTAARPALDPDADRIVYEVGSWPAALQTMLADSLTVADLPYEWDEQGDLVVYAAHEDEVEAIIDEMPDPDDPELVGEVSADDGIAVHELLDRLFVASSRLMSRDDPAAIVAVDEVVGTVERMGPPFGFEAPQWRALVTRAIRVRDAVEAGPDDPGALSDADLRVAARELRDLLRTYV